MRKPERRVVTGRLITFEGTEGTGKTTQIELLAAALEARGERVVRTREPGGTAFGVALRTILLHPGSSGLAGYAELFLYLADRAQHARESLKPALERGALVLCDRFTDATVAYQGYGRGLSVELIGAANARATDGIVPDLTILLDLPDVERGLERARRRQARDGSAGVADRFEREEVAFHRRVREGYLELAKADPGRFTVLSAQLSVPELHERILSRVASWLPSSGDPARVPASTRGAR
jgi:dTMP kinase